MKGKHITLYQGNLYKYVQDGTERSCIFICETNIIQNVCVLPLTAESENAIHIKSLNAYILADGFIEINRSNIKDVLRLKGKTAKIQPDEFLKISEFLLSFLSTKICRTFNFIHSKNLNNNPSDCCLTERYYKFIT